MPLAASMPEPLSEPLLSVTATERRGVVAAGHGRGDPAGRARVGGDRNRSGRAGVGVVVAGDRLRAGLGRGAGVAVGLAERNRGVVAAGAEARNVREVRLLRARLPVGDRRRQVEGAGAAWAVEDGAGAVPVHGARQVRSAGRSGRCARVDLDQLLADGLLVAELVVGAEANRRCAGDREGRGIHGPVDRAGVGAVGRVTDLVEARPAVHGRERDGHVGRVPAARAGTAVALDRSRRRSSVRGHGEARCARGQAGVVRCGDIVGLGRIS